MPGTGPTDGPWGPSTEFHTAVGTSFLGAEPADRDATAVALLVGKTTMHEIGIGVTGQNIHHVTLAFRDLEAYRVAHAVTIITETALAMEPYWAGHRKDFSPEARVDHIATPANLTGLPARASEENFQPKK